MSFLVTNNTYKLSGECRLCGRTSVNLDTDGYCEHEFETALSEEKEIARERALDEQEGETYETRNADSDPRSDGVL